MQALQGRNEFPPLTASALATLACSPTPHKAGVARVEAFREDLSGCPALLDSRPRLKTSSIRRGQPALVCTFQTKAAVLISMCTGQSLPG